MKQLYHFCITCHREVLFRDDEDFRNITNILALEAFSCQVELWVDAEMSTHIHGIGRAEDANVVRLCQLLKMRITKYHRNRHHGQGRLFDPGYFLLRLEGNNHILAALSYVLRNGLHHGQSATPFSYPHCTANHLFCHDLGKQTEQAAITSRHAIASNLPRRSSFPDHFAMNREGMLIRSSFEQISMVEHYYRTPRCFDYFMSRLSGEEWQREKQEDRNGNNPITLETMEPGISDKQLRTMLAGKKSRIYSPSRLTDMDICRIIDQEYVPGYRKSSVYLLSRDQRLRLGEDLLRRFQVSRPQLRRCLAIF